MKMHKIWKNLKNTNKISKNNNLHNLSFVRKNKDYKCLFSTEYKKIFTYLNQLLDINSYFALKKGFEIMEHL